MKTNFTITAASWRLGGACLLGAIVVACGGRSQLSGSPDQDEMRTERTLEWPADMRWAAEVVAGDGGGGVQPGFDNEFSRQFGSGAMPGDGEVVGWTRTLGNAELEWPSEVAVGADGTVVVTGTFRGTVDFDPGPGELVRTAAGPQDLYVLALDSGGSARWVRTLSAGPATDAGLDLALTRDGAVVVAGRFSGAVDFDPNPDRVDERVSSGEQDLFVVQFDASGNFRWARTIGGPGDDWGAAIAVAADGAVLVSGRTWGVVDFDADPDTEVLRGLPGAWSSFVASLEPESGALRWVSGFDGPGDAWGTGLAAGAEGALVVGRFSGTVDFDPDPWSIDERASVGERDAFVAALDSEGRLRWARTFGDEGEDWAIGVAAAPDGRVLVTGYYEGLFDFEVRAVPDHVSEGYWDVFVLCLDAQGERLWSTSLGGRGWDWGASLAIADDGVLVAGAFQGRVAFVPGLGESISNGEWDYFLVRLDATGVPRWVRTWGNEGRDYAEDVVVDADGSILMVGSFEDEVDFDPCRGGDRRVSNGSSDTFITRLSRVGCYR